MAKGPHCTIGDMHWTDPSFLWASILFNTMMLARGFLPMNPSQMGRGVGLPLKFQPAPSLPGNWLCLTLQLVWGKTCFVFSSASFPLHRWGGHILEWKWRLLTTINIIILKCCIIEAIFPQTALQLQALENLQEPILSIRVSRAFQSPSWKDTGNVWKSQIFLQCSQHLWAEDGEIKHQSAPSAKAKSGLKLLKILCYK